MGIHYVVGIVQSRLLLIFEDRIVKIVRSKAAAGKLNNSLVSDRHNSSMICGRQRCRSDRAIAAIQLVRIQPACCCLYLQHLSHFFYSAKAAIRDLHVGLPAAQNQTIDVHKSEPLRQRVEF